jgi:hypothetical protein
MVSIDEAFQLLGRFKLSSSRLRISLSSEPHSAGNSPAVKFEMEGRVTGGNDKLREVVFERDDASLTLNLCECRFEIVPPYNASTGPPFKATDFNVILRITFPSGGTCEVWEFARTPTAE